MKPRDLTGGGPAASAPVSSAAIRDGAEGARKAVAAVAGRAEKPAALASGGLQPPDDDEELIRRARSDDGRAMDRLVRRYQKKVYGIAYQLCGSDPEEARDVAQEALLQVFRKLDQFEGRSRFSTWVYRVAVNSCLDARRRRRRWLRMILPWRSEAREEESRERSIEDLPAPEESTNPVASVGTAELKRDVAKVLRGLSANQRMVFQLKVFQEMSISEIAEATGMAEGTVKSHLFRATQSVRGQLRRWVER